MGPKNGEKSECKSVVDDRKREKDWRETERNSALTGVRLTSSLERNGKREKFRRKSNKNLAGEKIAGNVF